MVCTHTRTCTHMYGKWLTNNYYYNTLNLLTLSKELLHNVLTPSPAYRETPGWIADVRSFDCNLYEGLDH